MKKILKCVGSIAFAVCIALASIIIPMKLSKKQSFLRTSLNDASASTVIPPSYIPDAIFPLDISFATGSIVIPYVSARSSSSLVTNFSSYFTSNGGVTFQGFNSLNFRFNLSIGSSDFYLQYNAVNNGNIYIYNNSNIPNSNNAPLSTISFPSFSFSSLESNFVANSIFKQSIVSPMQKFNVENTTYYTNFGFEIYKNNTNINDFEKPTFKMISIEILNSEQFLSKFGYESSFSNSNIIRYTDSVGYSYTIYIPCRVNVNDTNSLPWYYFYLTYRKYLLPDFFDLSDNNVYQQGVSDGYASGVPDGYNQGYSKGLAQGNTEGFNEGYIVGLNTSNNFTFQSLIGAVFDAPLNAFVSLFNFEILGVNLLSFITSILTFAITIFILRKILGGK